LFHPSHQTEVKATSRKQLSTPSNTTSNMPRGTKISPAKLAQSSASAKKIRELEKKADVAKKTAVVNGERKKTTPTAAPKVTLPPKPIAVEKQEDEPVVFDQKKASKVHYSHDEKRHMKHLRNKIRDGVELSEEEVLFATNHKIELSKAKKKEVSGDHPNKDAHHGKPQDKKKVETTKGHGKNGTTNAKAKKH